VQQVVAAHGNEDERSFIKEIEVFKGKLSEKAERSRLSPPPPF